LITEPSQKAVIAIDLTTKLISIISNNYGGSVPKYDSPALLAYSEQTGKLYVADVGLKAIFEVNLNTGARSIISDANIGKGINFDKITLSAIAVSKDGSKVYIGDQGNGSTLTQALISIDTSTGNRQIVSDYWTGTGTWLNGITDIELLSDSNQALIADNWRTIKLVDLSTGNRIVVADDAGTGEGESLLNTRRIEIGANENIVYGISANYEAIFAIDRFSGDRVIISK